MDNNNTIRCKLKYGNAEFEIEGSANSEMAKKVDSLYKMFTEAVTSEKVVSEPLIGGKPKRRGGGRRPPFIKSAILSIIEKEPKWLVDKSPEDVADKLKTSYGVPGAKVPPVSTALIRLFTDGELTRKEVDGKYLYSITALKRE